MLQVLANGLVNGAVLALIAISLTIIFGILRVPHFGLGGVFVWGAFVAFAAAGLGLPFGVAVLAAALAMALVGVLIERLAFRLTGRTFWGHGGIGSEPSTALLDVPLVDRLALEMAAHEETERRALEGELEELEAAWREADEIATIADALLSV